MAQRVNRGQDLIQIYIGDVLYMCFPSLKLVEIYRVNQEEITKHTMDCEPIEDVDKIELYCLHIEEQHEVVST